MKLTKFAGYNPEDPNMTTEKATGPSEGVGNELQASEKDMKRKNDSKVDKRELTEQEMVKTKKSSAVLVAPADVEQGDKGSNPHVDDIDIPNEILFDDDKKEIDLEVASTVCDADSATGKTSSGDAAPPEEQSDTADMIPVVAPATLPEGYSFTVQVDGSEFPVIVPPGGVEEGEIFKVPRPTPRNLVMVVPGSQPTTGSRHVPKKDTSLGRDDAPLGYWRHDLCSCFDVLCSCLFVEGFFCTPYLVAQLAQRMNLNVCGNPTRDASRTYMRLVVPLLIYDILRLIGIGLVLVPIYHVFRIILTMNTRYQYRKKYQIPATCIETGDGIIDDCCSAVFCSCCVSIQMARHTHDNELYPFACCSKTGLPSDAPMIV